MPAPNHIAPDKLVRLIGLPTAPVVVDLRDEAASARDPRFIPGARRVSPERVAGGQSVVLVCEDGGAVSQAAAFDLDAPGVHWSHRGERCTFDLMVDAFGLAGFGALEHLRVIVRGADTARLDLAPEAAGLLALSLGLSRVHADDNAQLEAGMGLYDALYRWARDARAETHDWRSHGAAAGERAGAKA